MHYHLSSELSLLGKKTIIFFNKEKTKLTTVLTTFCQKKILTFFFFLRELTLI
jgi:tRNA(His) 5'-end guanylyltransferase